MKAELNIAVFYIGIILYILSAWMTPIARGFWFDGETHAQQLQYLLWD